MDKVFSNKYLLLIGLCLSCLGCSKGVEHEDLQIFVEEAKSQPEGEIDPLPTFHPYETFKYSVVSHRSPFEVPLTITAEGTVGRKSTVKPDGNRKKEYLESFNFSSFQLVGSIKKDGTLWSLINDGDGGVHRVTLGHYIGKNHGKIVGISDSKVDVIEIVPDGKSGWVERPRALALKENG